MKSSVKANEESVEENDGKMRERMRAQASGNQNPINEIERTTKPDPKGHGA